MRKQIAVMFLDMDGTLSDGKIYVGPEGEVFKAFSCKDAYGVEQQLIPSGICPVLITGRNNPIVTRWAEDRGVTEVHQGVKDKAAKLQEILEQKQVSYDQVAYIGDDMNDYQCMKAIQAGGGLVGCPADAAKKIREIADFVAPRGGGQGAVRDFIEWVLFN